MRIFLIVDHGADASRTMSRFHVTNVRERGSSTGSSEELHIPTDLMSHIPSRHLIEELARRVNVEIVADDQPDPLTVDRGVSACTCAHMHPPECQAMGTHHVPECPMYNVGPM